MQLSQTAVMTTMFAAALVAMVEVNALTVSASEEIYEENDAVPEETGVIEDVRTPENSILVDPFEKESGKESEKSKILNLTGDLINVTLEEVDYVWNTIAESEASFCNLSNDRWGWFTCPDLVPVKCGNKCLARPKKLSGVNICKKNEADLGFGLAKKVLKMGFNIASTAIKTEEEEKEEGDEDKKDIEKIMAGFKSTISEAGNIATMFVSGADCKIWMDAQKDLENLIKKAEAAKKKEEAKKQEEANKRNAKLQNTSDSSFNKVFLEIVVLSLVAVNT
eukprot:Pgem_evm1s1491